MFKAFSRSLVALVLGSLGGLATGAEVSSGKILQLAEAEQPEVVETLEALVNIDTGTGDVAGLAEAEVLLVERLQALGAEVDTRPAEAFGGNNIVATLQGQGDTQFLLMVHYDTVFGEGEAEKRPFRTDEARAYGPGVADAKSGVAIILHTLELLQALEFDGYGTLTVLFNPDEEKGSMGSRDLIQELARQQDYVLSFEPSLGGQGEDSVTVVTKGINYAFLDVAGRASHAGAAPEQGRNSVIELAHQLLQLNDLGDPDKETTLNWTIVAGGTKRNIIPDQAAAEGDMRYFDFNEYDRVLADAQRITDNRLIPDTEVQFRLEQGRPPMPDNEGTRELAALAQTLYQDIGRELGTAQIGGGTDAAYAYSPDSAKPVVLESLGLVGAGYHSPDEYAELGSIVPRLYLATRLIMALSQGE